MMAEYTTQLQAGLGMPRETRALLDLWQPGMDVPSLEREARESGQFPSMSARRLRNVVAECFAPRLLSEGSSPANLLKRLSGVSSTREFNQLLFLYTSRANSILADFVRDVYWNAYRAGRNQLSTDDARRFVEQANEDGKTVKRWSESTVRRVSAYLTGACADFGLLESGRKRTRDILPFRIESRVAAILAYDLHFAGLGDNAVIHHPDWQLFGLEPADVLEELRRLSRKGLVIVQRAGDMTRIGWQHDTTEELIDAVAQS